MTYYRGEEIEREQRMSEVDWRDRMAEQAYVDAEAERAYAEYMAGVEAEALAHDHELDERDEVEGRAW